MRSSAWSWHLCGLIVCLAGASVVIAGSERPGVPVPGPAVAQPAGFASGAEDADDPAIVQTGFRGRCCPPAGCCPPGTYPCPWVYPEIAPPASRTTPTTPTTPTPETPIPEMTAPSEMDVASLTAPGGSAVGGPNFTGVGYIDSAIPVTQYRLRVDAAWGDNRPDRADFFYPKCGCFRAAGIDPNAPGPGTAPAKNVNYQQLYNYFEYAYNPRFSTFVNLPVRWVDIAFLPPGVPNENHGGFSDVQFGGKYAFLYTPDRVATAQLRVYAPSGNAQFGLGRNNWNLEPAFLVYQRLADRLYFEGEFRDFIPVASQDDFAGNVTRYGVGLSYIVYNRPYFRVAPVLEMVGWTVLSGKELADTVVKSAAGDTIVNAKFGLRIGFGRLVQPGFLNRADIYLGYGRALTGAVWYKDIIRGALRIRF